MTKRLDVGFPMTKLVQRIPTGAVGDITWDDFAFRLASLYMPTRAAHAYSLIFFVSPLLILDLSFADSPGSWFCFVSLRRSLVTRLLVLPILAEVGYVLRSRVLLVCTGACSP